MGFVGGLLGTSGGAAGTGFSGPQTTAIQDPTTEAQANEQYQNAQRAIAQQQAFTQAMQPGGTAALASQQNLLGQLGQQAQGLGPNPALSQLNQTTGQNIANQAAMMAGQRGSSANPALIARQAAQQGAATQQNAVGQAATMRAQQQLAAQQNLAQQQQAMVGQQAGALGQGIGAATGEQANILNAINAQNNARVGMQGNMNNANASLAGIQMQGQQNLMGSMMPSAGSIMSMIAEGGMVKKAEGGEVDTGEVESGSTPSPGSVNIPTIGNAFNSSSSSGDKKGLLSLLAPGGMIQPMGNLQAPVGPQSNFGQYLSGGMRPSAVTSTGPSMSGGPNIPTIKNYFDKPDQKKPEEKPDKKPIPVAGGPGDNSNNASANPMNAGSMSPDTMMAAKGGKVPALVSPGERYLPPKEVQAVTQGKKNPMEAGEKIPGKPKVGGAKNSYANDTVPKTLEEGGIVIPRSVTQGPNPHWNAMKFVHATLRKQK